MLNVNHREVHDNVNSANLVITLRGKAKIIGQDPRGSTGGDDKEKPGEKEATQPEFGEGRALGKAPAVRPWSSQAGGVLDSVVGTRAKFSLGLGDGERTPQQGSGNATHN